MNGYLEVAGQISNSAAVFLGGVLSEYSFTWCYLAVLAIAVGSMMPVLCMKEPPTTMSGAENQAENRTEGSKDRSGLRKHAAACFRILRGNSAVRRILLYYPAVSALWCVIFFYGQEYFARLGLNRIEISLVMLAGGGFSILGAMSSQRLTERLGRRIRFAAGLWAACGSLMVSTGYLPAVIAGFLLGSFSTEILYPLESAELNSRIPSAQRATIISVDSMMFSVFMITVFPLMGFLADTLGMAAGFGLTGILMLNMVIAAGMRWKEE